MLAYRHYIHEEDKKSDYDITWLHRQGNPMQKEHWHSYHVLTLGYLIESKRDNEPAMLCIFHAGADPVEFQLPVIEGVKQWKIMIDTAASAMVNDIRKLPAQRMITLAAFSTLVLIDDYKETESHD